jgi:molybdopterin-binding protein
MCPSRRRIPDQSLGRTVRAAAARAQTVPAAITHDSVDELKLATGQVVYAVFKASDVTVRVA